MPRQIPPGLAAALQAETLTLAILTRIDRLDGVSLGFADIDRDITFGGLLYEAGAANDASAISAKTGTEGSNLDVEGLLGTLTSDAITDTDLLAGRYDGASVEIFVVNYEETPAITERIILFSGSVDECEFGSGHYRVTLRSLMQHLSQNIGELTSQTCLVKRFGDERCKKDLTALRHDRTVSAVTTPLILRFGGDTITTGFYNYGVVTFTSGNNAGLEMEIKSHVNEGSEAVLTLQQAFPFLIVPGDSATLTEGCDRTAAVCKRHQNIINFRGFDKLPGSDRILRVGRRQ